MSTFQVGVDFTQEDVDLCRAVVALIPDDRAEQVLLNNGANEVVLRSVEPGGKPPEVEAFLAFVDAMQRAVDEEARINAVLPPLPDVPR